MKELNLKAFVASYLLTAAWVTVDSRYECEKFTKLAQEQAKEDCLEFIRLVKERFGEEKGLELLTIEGNDLSYLAPHDFWLTRNGHGAGFWDKEEKYGEAEAVILTEICEEIGVCECYHIRGPKSRLTF